ncbi:MAG: Ig-like domain-containing protein, partial [bacterium]
PKDGATLWDATVVRGTARDSDGGVVLVQVRFDEGAWLPANGTGAWHFALLPQKLGEGSHVLEARAFDGLDHAEVVSVPFKVAGPVSAASPPPRPGDDENGSPSAGLLAVAVALGIGAAVARRRSR